MKKVMMMLVCVLLWGASLAIAGEKVVYNVKKGDTLGQLMFTWKVQGVDIKQIQKWNPGLGTQLSVGQRIEYYLSDQLVSQKISAEEIKKIVDETIAAQSLDKKRLKELEQKLDYRPASYLLVASIIAATIFAIMAFLFLRRPKWQIAITQPVETKPAHSITKTGAEAILETRWIEATDINGVVYLVRLVKKSDNKWYTPFMTLENDDKPLFRADFQAAKNAVRGCVKNPRYADQFAALLAAGEDVKQK